MEQYRNNGGDLHAEIGRLKILKAEQRTALGERFDSPFATLKTVRSLFPTKAGKHQALVSAIWKDPVVAAGRLLLPLLLNKTIFRRSGFFMRFLVTVAASTLARFFTMDRLGGWIFNIESMIRNRNRNHEKETLRQ